MMKKNKGKAKRGSKTSSENMSLNPQKNTISNKRRSRSAESKERHFTKEPVITTDSKQQNKQTTENTNSTKIAEAGKPIEMDSNSSSAEMLAKELTAKGLSPDKWAEVFKQQGLQSKEQFQHIDRSTLNKLLSQTMFTWERSALYKLVEDSKQEEISRQEVMFEKLRSKIQDPQKNITDTFKMNDDRRKTIFEEQTWMKPFDLDKKVKERLKLETSGQQLVNRKPLASCDVIRKIAGGQLLRGQFMYKDLETSSSYRQKLIEVDENIELMSPGRSETMEIFEFDNKKQSDKFDSVLTHSGMSCAVAISKGFSSVAGFQVNVSGEKTNVEDDKTTTNRQACFVKINQVLNVPMASFTLSNQKVSLSLPALKALKGLNEFFCTVIDTSGTGNESVTTENNLLTISQLLETTREFLETTTERIKPKNESLTTKKNAWLKETNELLKNTRELLQNNNESFTTKCKLFFSEFGSHYYSGLCHFGGRYVWTVTSLSNSTDYRKENIQMAKKAFNGSVAGGITWISGEIKGSYEKKSETVAKNRKSSEKCEISKKLEKFGGPQEVDDISQWKKGLAEYNNTWIVIDKDVSQKCYNGVWDLIQDQKQEFKHATEFCKSIKDVWEQLAEHAKNSEMSWSKKQLNIVDEINGTEVMIVGNIKLNKDIEKQRDALSALTNMPTKMTKSLENDKHEYS